jgi:hypothetical protein
MALNTQLSNGLVNAQAELLTARCSDGKIKFYNGTQPATADTAITSQTLGVTLTFSNLPFTYSNGVATANAITSGVAVASITPTWARISSLVGTTVMDISAGSADCNITIDSFTVGTSVYCSSFVHTIEKSHTGV